MNSRESSEYEIDISNQQKVLPVDVALLRQTIEAALSLEDVGAAVLSITIVDNEAIHRLNREHLQHDYPTDVISFPLECSDEMVEGEIVASAEMACQMAASGQWSPQDELRLYVVHGLLHLCGYDDLTPNEKSMMRERERAIMGHFGLNVVHAAETDSES
ncbi:MAG: rRNA maturation RNase YbeY [Planctomyces sp.]